jgi:hypothetical protein
VETVIVQLPAAPGRERPATLRLAPGVEAAFGRDPAADVVLADPRVPRLAGRIRAVGDYWLASNLTCSHTFVVENPESAGEYVKVPPRRLELPVPFEFARLVVVDPVSFLVFAPQHAYADAAVGVSAAGEATVAAFPLDETAKYFLILVALCEPRLRDPDSLVLPTAPEVIARLAPLPHCAGLTRAAVNFGVDYLARTKLRVREPDPETAAGKADWQREALVRTALRFDLVRPEHLRLLP